eukprot:IDg7345t1
MLITPPLLFEIELTIVRGIQVSFAIRRLCATGTNLKEVNGSHQQPWARHAIAIDDFVASKPEAEAATIGRVRFSHSLCVTVRQELEDILDRNVKTLF